MFQELSQLSCACLVCSASVSLGEFPVQRPRQVEARRLRTERSPLCSKFAITEQRGPRPEEWETCGLIGGFKGKRGGTKISFEGEWGDCHMLPPLKLHCLKCGKQVTHLKAANPES